MLAHPGKLALVSLGTGVAALLFGTVRTLPQLWPGQLALSIIAGAALIALGSARLGWLIAFHPAVADALFDTPTGVTHALGTLSRLDARSSFERTPLMRWALLAVFAAFTLGALALLANDLWVWRTLGWSVPAYADRLVMG
jgi:hypothetical protein